MNKNTSKLKQIVIILLFIIILAIGAYFNKEEEIKLTMYYIELLHILKVRMNWQVV